MSAKGISTNPEKVENWPVPKNGKEVQFFLGQASHYRQFIYKFAKEAWCFHELVGSTASKTKKKARTNYGKFAAFKPEQTIFKWMMKHQEEFDALKEVINTAPVLGYPNFFREFILETDASLNGLGTILSQQGKDGKILCNTITSDSLCHSERSMYYYSSAQLQLLALKWTVIEKFCDFLLSSQFQVYMDNNLFTYVQDSKLGASQIRWLSELELFGFTIR